MADFGALHVQMGLRRSSYSTIMRSTSTLSQSSVPSTPGNSPGRSQPVFPDDKDADLFHEAPTFQTSLPHVGFSARNEIWTSVQHTMLSVFQKKTVEGKHMTSLLQKIKEVKDSEIGPFIYDYYKNQILKKGCRSLRDALKREVDNGCDMLAELGDTWNCFYREILPTMQATLFHIDVKDLSIKEVTLLGFRDHVVLKLDLEDLLEKPTSAIPPSIHQMLLVLQGVCEVDPPNENFLHLEKLVARVVTPYLGYHGLYLGHKDPVVKANRDGNVRKISRGKRKDSGGRNAKAVSVQLPLMIKDDDALVMKKSLHIRNPSTPNVLLPVHTLSPVQEADAEATRRHSVSGILM